tara:strand:- start:188 stop:1303 length:1116 start_codon:yes stop_codon:yes gene_type:complete
MTVRVSKPAFNLRDKISELDRPVGVHGNEILKSNSLEETCAIVGSGRKNLVINGNFDVWQRGTSFSSFNSMRLTADRWFQYAAGSSTITASRQQFTAGQTEVPGNPRYYYRYDNTPDADTTWLELFHRIEDVTRFSDVPVTISWWMRANKPQYGEDEVRLSQNFGTSGSTKVSILGPRFDIHTSWQKYEFTFNLPSVSGKTINANSFLEIHWLRVDNSVAADTYYDIAQVQLEYGRGATTFEQRSYAEEVELCQRYFAVVPAGTVFPGRGNSGSSYIFSYSLPVPLRTSPTVGTSDDLAHGTFSMRRYRDDTGVSDSTSTPTTSSTYFQGNTNLIHLIQGGFTGADDRSATLFLSGGAITLDSEFSATYSP